MRKTPSLFGTGVDVEHVSRFERWKTPKSPVLKKMFHPIELRYCFSKHHPAQHLAARFAGKEAVIKAIVSAGGPLVAFRDIQVLNSKKGPPIVKLAQKDATHHVVLSLSHTASTAIAFALAIRI